MRRTKQTLGVGIYRVANRAAAIMRSGLYFSKKNRISSGRKKTVSNQSTASIREYVQQHQDAGEHDTVFHRKVLTELVSV